MIFTSDVTVDTVRICWKVNPDSINLTDWQKTKTTDIHSYFKAYNKYLRFHYTIEYRLLIAEFSASSLVNGCNAIPYEFHQYDQLKRTVEQAVFKVTSTKLFLCDATISRIDIAHSLEFNSLSDAKAFIKALNCIPVIGRAINYTKPGSIYDYRGLRCGELVKTYIKNDDPKIPKNIRDTLKPTVRIEAECKKRAKPKGVLRDYSAEYVLMNPEIWSVIFNQTLARLHLDGVILSKNSFDHVIERVLRTAYPNARDNTICKYMRIIKDVLNGEKPDHLALKLCRILMNAGALPLCSDIIDTLLSTNTISHETMLLYYVVKGRKNNKTTKSVCPPYRSVNRYKRILNAVEILDSS